METDSIQLCIVLTLVMTELQAKNSAKKKKKMTDFYFFTWFLYFGEISYEQILHKNMSSKNQVIPEAS